MRCEVGERLKIGEDFCTIRFVGYIKEWSDEVVYGVEWDNPARGKHNGTVKGKQYFKSHKSGAASFIKESKVSKECCTRKSFYEVCYDICANSDIQLDDMYFGEKRVETYGFEPLTTRFIQNSNLNSLSLCNLEIYTAGSVKGWNGLEKLNRQLLQLDISSNLFSDFQDILNIISTMPKLQALDLSFNKFHGVTWKDGQSFKSISELRMSFCDISIDDIKNAFMLFPNLKKIALSGNEMESFDITLPPSLLEIDLGENLLCDIPETLARSNVETVYLSKNRIKHITEAKFDSVKTLDLSQNLLADWSCVKQISAYYPSLSDLRINDNPFTRNESGDSSFLLILAQLNEIDILNGTILPKGTREEAEKYLISQVNNGTFDYDTNSSNWLALLDKYDMRKNNSVQTEFASPIEILQLSIVFQQQTIGEVSVLSSYSIRFLKSIISRRLKTSIFKIRLAHFLSPGVIQEFGREFSPISDFSVRSGDKIMVEKV